MRRRRVFRSGIALFVAAIVSLTALGDSTLVGAQGGTTIRIVDDSAELTVVVGQHGITPGRATGPSAPVVTCSLFSGLENEWHNLVRDWGALVDQEYYWQLCNYVAGGFFSYRQIQFTLGDPTDGTGVTTREIRDVAQGLLPVGPVVPELSPDGKQVTGLETWIWPGVATALGPVYASAGGVEVGVRASLTRMDITPGDGESSFPCTAFTEWQRGATNPACSYTYLEQPTAGTWTMTTQTEWTFDWLDWNQPWDNGYGVAEPIIAFDVEVGDLEAVISTR